MTRIEVRAGDITKLAVDAIANAANTQLRHGGGVAGAIVRAGGHVIQQESDRRAPIALGEAVETGAGELPSRWNHLVGYDRPRRDAAVAHFTIGGPWFEPYRDCEFADEWRREREAMHRALGDRPRAVRARPRPPSCTRPGRTWS